MAARQTKGYNRFQSFYAWTSWGKFPSFIYWKREPTLTVSMCKWNSVPREDKMAADYLFLTHGRHDNISFTFSFTNDRRNDKWKAKYKIARTKLKKDRSFKELDLDNPTAFYGMTYTAKCLQYYVPKTKSTSQRIQTTQDWSLKFTCVCAG